MSITTSTAGLVSTGPLHTCMCRMAMNIHCLIILFLTLAQLDHFKWASYDTDFAQRHTLGVFFPSWVGACLHWSHTYASHPLAFGAPKSTAWAHPSLTTAMLEDTPRRLQSCPLNHVPGRSGKETSSTKEGCDRRSKKWSVRRGIAGKKSASWPTQSCARMTSQTTTRHSKVVLVLENITVYLFKTARTHCPLNPINTVLWRKDYWRKLSYRYDHNYATTMHNTSMTS